MDQSMLPQPAQSPSPAKKPRKYQQPPLPQPAQSPLPEKRLRKYQPSWPQPAQSPLPSIRQLSIYPGFDLNRARRETPGCEKVLHFNNAGASLMPQPVLDAMVGHLRLESEIGGYEASDRAHEAIERVYDSIARLINCNRDELAIVENSTRAWDMAFYSIPFKPGDRILTSVSEYASNYIAYLQVARRTGAVIEVVPNDEHGQISVEALANLIDRRTKLIAVSHIPTNGGLVNPAAAIGRVAKQAGVLFLLDACQSVGQMPIDVNAIGCDMLSATGRKYLRGPRAVGLLYVRNEIIDQLEPPFLDIHAAEWVARDRFEIRGDARRFESWEQNYAGKLGLGAAVDYAMEWGVETTWPRIRGLGANLRARLSEMPGVKTCDLGAERCGIVTFTVDGLESEYVQRFLAARRINVSISPTRWTRLDMEERRLSSVVRASLHCYNNQAEIDVFCDAVAELL